MPPGGFAELPSIQHAAIGMLQLRRAFADGGAGRVVVRGRAGTPDPVFAPELLDFRIDGRRADSGTATRELYFAGDGRDPVAFAIAPGRYRLTATRGPEYELEQRDVTREALVETCARVLHQVITGSA